MTLDEQVARQARQIETSRRELRREQAARARLERAIVHHSRGLCACAGHDWIAGPDGETDYVPRERECLANLLALVPKGRR